MHLLLHGQGHTWSNPYCVHCTSQFLLLTIHLLVACRQVVLEVKGEAQLVALSKKLQDVGVQHKVWVEQPENYPVCLATKPYRKSEVGQHFRKLQLCKAALAKSQAG